MTSEDSRRRSKYFPGTVLSVACVTDGTKPRYMGLVPSATQAILSDVFHQNNAVASNSVEI